MGTDSLTLGTARTSGLRERQKRRRRQQLSDTATRLFLKHGFDAVRVADVAEECGVSEATVFNYFATKEALVLDRLEETMASLPAALSERDSDPVDAVLEVLSQELAQTTDAILARDDRAQATKEVLRFAELLTTTPSLRAHLLAAMDQFVSVAAGLLAERCGCGAEDPEPQIAARALLGLWYVQAKSLQAHLATSEPDRIHQEVTREVLRAARVLTLGLSSIFE